MTTRVSCRVFKRHDISPTYKLYARILQQCVIGAESEMFIQDVVMLRIYQTKRSNATFVNVYSALPITGTAKGRHAFKPAGNIASTPSSTHPILTGCARGAGPLWEDRSGSDLLLQASVGTRTTYCNTVIPFSTTLSITDIYLGVR